MCNNYPLSLCWSVGEAYHAWFTKLNSLSALLRKEIEATPNRSFGKGIAPLLSRSYKVVANLKALKDLYTPLLAIEDLTHREKAAIQADLSVLDATIQSLPDIDVKTAEVNIPPPPPSSSSATSSPIPPPIPPPPLSDKLSSSSSAAASPIPPPIPPPSDYIPPPPSAAAGTADVPPPPPPPSGDYIPPPPPGGADYIPPPPKGGADFIPPPPAAGAGAAAATGSSGGGGGADFIPPPSLPGIKVVKPAGSDDKDKGDDDDEDGGVTSIKHSHKKTHKSFNAGIQRPEPSTSPMDISSGSKKHKSKSARTMDTVEEKPKTLPLNPAREKIMDGTLNTPDEKTYTFELYNDYIVVKMDPDVNIINSLFYVFINYIIIYF